MLRSLKKFDLDDGIGLVEVIVALFLFAIISISLLPVLYNGIQTSVQNSTNASANRLASQELELAQNVTTCSALNSFVGASGGTTVDDLGRTLTAYRSIVGSCSTSATTPATAKFQVTVRVASESNTRASAVSLVFLATGS